MTTSSSSYLRVVARAAMTLCVCLLAVQAQPAPGHLTQELEQTEQAQQSVFDAKNDAAVPSFAQFMQAIEHAARVAALGAEDWKIQPLHCDNDRCDKFCKTRPGFNAGVCNHYQLCSCFYLPPAVFDQLFKGPFMRLANYT